MIMWWFVSKENKMAVFRREVEGCFIQGNLYSRSNLNPKGESRIAGFNRTRSLYSRVALRVSRACTDWRCYEEKGLYTPSDT